MSMTLPKLENWETTVQAIHQVAMLLNPIQNALFDHRNNYLELTMLVRPYGLASKRLPKGGELCINLKEGMVVYHPPNQAEDNEIYFPISDFTQAGLCEVILQTMREDELAEFFGDSDAANLTQELVKRINADESKVVSAKIDDINGDENLTFDADVASDYADVLYSIFTGVARFRATLEGHMTPIVVWPEHFDLSTLWFAPDNPEMDDHKTHINIGFAPYSGGLARPYIYAYAYPYPENYDAPALPAPARWETEDYTGVYVAYDDLLDSDDLAQTVEMLSSDIFDALHNLVSSS